MILSPSPNFDERAGDGTVDMLVLHYTGMESPGAALERLRNPAAKVSVHYLIDEDGIVHGLVSEEMRAWHAGVSRWRGETDINARSIGIELVNPGHEFGYRPFPEAQMIALEALALEILGRHPIPPRNVVGHSDVAPGRKTDPGELFDWPRLAKAGIGLWPETGNSSEAEDVLAMLESYGYGMDDPPTTVAAFQRHFRPHGVDGGVDGDTAARVAALLRMVG